MRAFSSVLLAIGLFAFNALGEDVNSSASPRQLYNDGTQRLREGKLQEAEACLQSAVASQQVRVQAPALYNLGEARFTDGKEQLKKAPDGNQVHERSKDSSDNATGALQDIDKALAGDDVSAMIEAYWHGRGARKDLKGAMDAVKSAMDKYGGVLQKWQRASGDFKSDFELAPADTDAKTNADMVDREIAKLIDKQQMMMQMMGMMQGQRSELSKKMAMLKKKIPSDQGEKLTGKNGDEDDDDDEGKKPKDLKDGMEEQRPQSGKEMALTYDEASRLLDMLKLDSNRKLPLGATNGTPRNKDRNGRDW